MIRYILLFIIFLVVFLAYSLLKVRSTPSVSVKERDTTLIGDTRKLHRHVKQLTVYIGSRSVHEYEKIEATKEYIVTCLKSFGYAPSLQTYTYSGKKYSNVIASRKGAKLPDESVIVGAHYDTVYGTPGADDNASAVATLLEIAQALKDFSPDRTLKLIFFVIEEPPVFRSEHMASYVYAKEAKARNENIKSMISLEMLGYYTNEKDGQTFPFPMMSLIYPSTPNFIAVVGNLSSRNLVRKVENSLRASSRIPVETLSAFSFVPGVDFSDHRSFWEMGYPAIMITDTAFYRNPNYHTETDTIDTLDFDNMSDLLRGLIQAAKDLTDSSLP
ncbi:MAG: M28 family peptidase [Syntrophales bacterium LBB04]|nr:M28 family peptidase [Syntrophales bacterium LBB04]